MGVQNLTCNPCPGYGAESLSTWKFGPTVNKFLSHFANTWTQEHLAESGLVRERQTVLDWATARDDGAGSSDNYDVQSSSHIIGKLLTLSLQAGCPFFHQTSRVKALRGLNRSTNEWMTTSHIPLFVVTKRQNCAAQLTTLWHGTLSSLCWTLWTIHEISELDSTARIFNTTTSQLHLLLQLLLLLILDYITV